MDGSKTIPPGIDPTKPNVGRIWDYLLGGTEWFEIDKMAAERLKQLAPELAEDGVWANRGFLQRSARWLAEKAGIRQFIDIGAGLPTRNNTHEAVRAVAPDARVVYVDNDPVICEYSRSLLKDTPNTFYLCADLEDPDSILNNSDVRALIDFSQPVGLILAAVVHFVPDERDPWGLLRRYKDALAPGSYVALSHGTTSRTSPELVEKATKLYSSASAQLYMRSEEDIERLFEGLELVPPYPGAPATLTYAGLWGAEVPEDADSEGSRYWLCGVGRKP
ncbi:SAM-dependent methyltransferase [Thermasporomyces composti]|jgi:O-methyltransferase involved in polyketide biosynthesis|uniref:S-adenosyl methyltransferase n=1 Tax=Thermasporomyces composti TaxID=696763 RepID=A0A3D9V600_THECX|nr:SAM-dependent methyltransferase [Thermasporomyces composti]REF37222.1 S-adenosyl methyltransferase [Thermasporomyces composti]